MSTIRTTATSLEFSYTSIGAPACCSAMGLAFLSIGLFSASAATFPFVAFSLFCFFLASVFMEKTVTRIDLANRIVTISRKRPHKAYEASFPLEDLLAVCLEQTQGSKTTTYRVALVTAKRSYPLTLIFTGGNGPADDAERIYVWLIEQGLDVESTSAHHPR